MKKVTRMIWGVLLSALMAPWLTSCESDDSVSPIDTTLSTPEFEKMSGKYEITDSDSPYSSVELGASGNYIVIRNGYQTRVAENSYPMLLKRAGAAVQSRASESNGVIYGTFTKTTDGKYDLEGFGVVELVFGKDGQVKELNITPEGSSTPISFTAKKAETMGDDDLTNALCRTWYGKGGYGVEIEIATKDTLNKYVYQPGDYPDEFLFSKSGTYLLNYKMYHELEAGYWKWSNKNALSVRYWWDYDDPEDGGIINLSFDRNTMTVHETYDEDGIRYVDYLIFEDLDSLSSDGGQKPEDVEQPQQDTPANRVFKGNFPRIMDGDTYTYTDGYLTKIENMTVYGDMTTFTYNYLKAENTEPDVKIVSVNADGSHLLTVNATLNEQGFMAKAECFLGGENEAIVQSFGYDSEGHLISISSRGINGESDYVFEWNEGNLVYSTGGRDKNTYFYEYGRQMPNTNNIMFFSRVYKTNLLSETEFLYWSGLLGMPSKELPTVSTTKDVEEIVAKYNWSENCLSFKDIWEYKIEYSFGK